MKTLIKASLITTLLVLTSCAHHRGGCDQACKDACKTGQCKMDSKHCEMKKEATPAAPAEVKK